MKVMFTSLSAIVVGLFVAGPVSADIIGGNGEPDATWNSYAMQLWLRADQGAEEAAGDPAEPGDTVWYWRDQSTGSYDGWNNTATKRPLLVGSAHNGQPALRFDGADDWLYHGDVLDQDTDSFTILIVFSSASTVFTAHRALIEKRDGTDRYSVLFYRSNHTSPGLYSWYGDGVNVAGAGPLGSDYAAVLDGSPHIAVMMVDHGDTMYQYLDGGSPATVDISSIASQDNAVALRTGSDSGGGSLWNGEIAEIIIYKGALSPADLNAVGFYLQDKYGADAGYAPPSATILDEDLEPSVTWNDQALQLWLRADQGAEEAAGDPAEPGDTVWYWRDQSTGSYDGWNNTATKRPLLVGSAHNGQPALQFDGADDWLYHGDVLDQDTNSFTILTVFSSAGTVFPAHRALIEKRDGTDRYSLLFYRSDHTSPGLYSWYGDGVNAAGAGPLGSDYPAVLDGSPHIAVMMVDHGDTMYQYLDGGSPATVDIASIGSQDNAAALRTGSDSGGGSLWNGEIAEILMYRGALSAGDLDMVGWYLQEKYGVTGDYSGPATGTVILVQ